MHEDLQQRRPERAQHAHHADFIQHLNAQDTVKGEGGVSTESRRGIDGKTRSGMGASCLAEVSDFLPVRELQDVVLTTRSTMRQSLWVAAAAHAPVKRARHMDRLHAVWAHRTVPNPA